MTKNLYLIAWFLLATIVFFSALTGTLTPAASLLVLGLVFTLMLWSVIAHTREIKTE